MKSRVVKWLLGVLGFSSMTTSCETIEDIFRGPVAMYGCPSADYVFNVDVVDSENDAPIKGIRVSAIEKREQQYWDSETGRATYDTLIDTLARGVTDANGRVVLNTNTFPHDKHTIVADDVDGEQNGSFHSSSVVLTTTSEDYKNPSSNGWYEGTATQNITLKLNKR